MTDFSRNSNVYYEINGYNSNSSQQSLAETDIAFQYPLIPKADDYTLGLVKAKVDLSTIPLTTKNIPLNTYGVALRSKTGVNSPIFYAKQLNSTKNDYMYNVSDTGLFTKYIYSNTNGTPNLPPVISAQLVGITSVSQLVIDDYENIYVSGNSDGSNIFDTLFVFDKNGGALTTYSFESIQAMCISFDQRLFVADETMTGSTVKVYSITPSSGVLALVNTITTIYGSPSNLPLANVRSVCADLQLIVGFNANEFCIYDTDLTPLATFQKSEIQNQTNLSSMLGINTANSFVVVDEPTPKDVLWGRYQPTSPYQYENMISNTQIMPAPQTGVYYQCPPVYFKTNNLVVLDTDGSTRQYVYQGDNTIATYHTEVATSPALAWLSSDTNLQGFYGNNIATPNLYGFSVNPYVGAYQTIDSDFQVSNVLPIGQFSFQKGSNKIIANASDLNLYISSQGIYPREFITSNRVEGSSFGSANFNNSLVQTISTASVDAKFSYISSVDNKIRVITDTGFSIYNSPDYTPSGTSHAFSFPNGEDQVISACQMGQGGYFAVLAGQSITPYTGRYIYIYNENSGTLIQTIDLTGNCQYAQIASIKNPSGKTILLVSGGVNTVGFSLWNWTSTNFPTNLLTSTYQYTGLQFFGAWFNGPDYYITQSATGAPNQLLIINFSDANYDNVLSGTYIDTTTTYDPKINISGNDNLKEIYAKPNSSSSTIINMYNVNAGFIENNPETITFTQDVSNYIYAIPQLNGLYSWTALTMPMGFSGNTYGFAISYQNPSTIYLVQNTTFTTFVASISSGTSISTPVVLNSVSGKFTQIGCIYGQSSSLAGFKAYAYKITDQSSLGTYNFSSSDVVKSVARNNVENSYYFGLNYPNEGILATDASLNSLWQNDVYTSAYAIFSKNGQNIDAGKADIYDYSVLIKSINDALALAWLSIGGTSAYLEAPYLTLNYTNGLVTLNYSSDYTANSILFNFALNQLVVFPSAPDSILTNPQMYLILITPNTTSLTQNVKTIYQFNSLDKILFISNSLFVQGLYQQNNVTNNIIASVSLPITDTTYVLNIGQVLYFQANFINSVQMGSNLPVNRLQLAVYWQDTQGNQYPVYLNPNTNWSAKLIFMKKN